MKFKKLDPRATAPFKARPTDAGWDLYAMEDTTIPSLIKQQCSILISWTFGAATRFLFSKTVDVDDSFNCIATKIPTGIAVQLPEWHVGMICDRSGMGSKLIKVFGGIIDESYRGDVTVCLANFSFHDYQVKAGDRIAQLLVIPVSSEIMTEAELSETDRDSKGFGSSGS
jgi:dUTP pyrophosphatase